MVARGDFKLFVLELKPKNTNKKKRRREEEEEKRRRGEETQGKLLINLHLLGTKHLLFS